MRILKKALCTTLALLTITAGASLPNTVGAKPLTPTTGIVQMIDANAATVRTGRFNSWNWTGYTYINSTNIKKSPKIKICTFDAIGHRSGGTIDIQIFSSNGKLLKTYYTKGTVCYISLPKGYSRYKIRIRPHNYGSGIIGTGRNWTNIGKCVMWSIDAYSYCYV